MSKKEIEERLGQVENLPSLPIIIQQIQKLMASPDSNMKNIALVIAKDQAIATRVIRLVNSAYYGLRERVNSIQHAIVILGLNTVRNLVTGTAVIKAFEDSPWSSSFDRNRFWLHSIGTAMGCRKLAVELGMNEPDDYFLAGLVHDIGILVIDQFLHDEFETILQRTTSEGIDYLISERNNLDCTHEDVGAFLVRNWKLPEDLANVIQYHHRPIGLPKDVEKSKPRIAVVHLLETKSRQMESGTFIRNFQSDYCPRAFYFLKTNEKTVDRIFAAVEKEVEQVAGEWGVGTHG